MHVHAKAGAVRIRGAEARRPTLYGGKFSAVQLATSRSRSTARLLKVAILMYTRELLGGGLHRLHCTRAEQWLWFMSLELRSAWQKLGHCLHTRWPAALQGREYKKLLHLRSAHYLQICSCVCVKQSASASAWGSSLISSQAQPSDGVKQCL